MKRISQVLCCAVMVLLMTGCVSAPTVEEIANASYGREMTQEECESIAEEIMRNRPWKDPYSIVLEYEWCYKGYKQELFKKAEFGYIIEGTVNAKTRSALIRGRSRFISSCVMAERVSLGYLSVAI